MEEIRISVNDLIFEKDQNSIIPITIIGTNIKADFFDKMASEINNSGQNRVEYFRFFLKLLSETKTPNPNIKESNSSLFLRLATTSV